MNQPVETDLRSNPIYADRNNYFGKKIHYFIYIMMLGSTDNILNITMLLFAEVKGGAFIFFLLLTTFFFAIPISYVECFLGIFSRRTNGHLFNLTPFFMGYCIVLLIINFLYIPIASYQTAVMSVNMIKILTNSSYNKQCYHDTQACYDYKIFGKINDTCQSMYQGLYCASSMQVIRYPMEYNYYMTFKTLDSDLYPNWSLFLIMFLQWCIIWLLVYLKLSRLGFVLQTVVGIYFFLYTFILILALKSKGSWEDIEKMMTIRTDNLTFGNVSEILMLSFRRLGLVAPLGQMAIASKLNSKYFDLPITTSLNLLMGLYIILTGFSVAGVIAEQFGCLIWDIVSVDGLVLVLIPEFFSFLEIPVTFIVTYYIICITKEILMTAIGISMLFNAIMEYLPNLMIFESYMKMGLCFFEACFMTLFIFDFSRMELLTYFNFCDLYWTTPIFIFVEVLLLFYIYGLNRLRDDILFTYNEHPSLLLQLEWLSAPVLMIIMIICLWTRRNTISYEKEIKQDKEQFEDYYRVQIFHFVLFGLMIFILLFDLVCAFIKHTPVSYFFKPNFNWGPLEPQLRARRKKFIPSQYIRSQKSRQRKYKKMYLDIEPSQITSQIAKVKIKDFDDLESALTGGIDENESKQATIHTQHKGKIFADMEYFANLDNISFVSIRTKKKTTDGTTFYL